MSHGSLLMMERIKSAFKIPISNYIVYFLVYFIWGISMNEFGKFMEIACFTYWWQVITVYLLYMVPLSIWMRNFQWYDQYAYGLFCMGILEFGGYSLGTSIAFENNLIDKIFGIRNFSLAMTLFFGFYFPLGNWLVNHVHQLILKQKIS